MKKTNIIFTILMAIVIMLFSALPSAMSQENQGNENLKAMILELETKIKDADQRMVAHPKFLEELNTLVEKYKAFIRKIFFKDGFKDGNFTQNPQWQVESGHFSVNDAHHLATDAFAKPVEKKREQKPKSIEEQAIGLVLDSLFKPTEKKSDQVDTSSDKPSQETTPASIFTKTEIPPDFEINIQFLSNSKWGDFEIILLGSAPLVPQYRLSYKAASSIERPLELIRESNKRKFVIEAATQYPSTDDGKLHHLTWVRYKDGAMKVFMDNQIILETYEVYFRDRFNGLKLLNNGGSYEFASVEVFQAVKPEM